METTVNVFALIPARGGSKGLSRKNLKMLGGVSLVGRAITVALGILPKSQVVVSSEDQEILTNARFHGSETIVRSESSADDAATAADVVSDFISSDFGIDKLRNDSWIVYLQPTSPFRTVDFLAEGLELAMKSNSPVVSISKAKSQPWKTVVLESTGELSPVFDPSMVTGNRQDQPTAYIPDGNFYIFRLEQFSRHGDIPVNGATGVISPNNMNVDIDSLEDYQYAIYLEEDR